MARDCTLSPGRPLLEKGNRDLRIVSERCRLEGKSAQRARGTLLPVRPGGSRLVAGRRLAALLAAGLVGGCTPGEYRREADRASYEIIARARSDSLGRAEPFSIETPEQTLRRRLLLDQALPTASHASLSSRDVEPIPQWPDGDYLKRATSQPATDGPPAARRLTLTDVLQIAASESRDFQGQKEAVFRAALALDLERDAFRFTWSGVLRTLFQSNLQQNVVLDEDGRTDLQTVRGMEYGGSAETIKRLRNGLSATGAIGLDLVSLLTQQRPYSRGVYADVTATLPLMRGSGEFVVTEPLTQAERDVIYAIYQFERFKQTFAVDIASEYLSVLQQRDQVANAEQNYRNLIASTRRARRLADAGRLPEIQVDQSRQDELRSRQRWVATREAYQRRLDSFKTTLGLPADAEIDLDDAEFESLARRLDSIIRIIDSEPAASMPASQAASAPAGTTPPQDLAYPTATAPVTLDKPGEGSTPGPYEFDAGRAVRTALEKRLDLRVAVGRVFDAQRVVAVAADQLRADVTLLGSGSAGARRTLGSAGQENSILRPDEGSYSALLTIDLPLERTAERNVYRGSLINFEAAVRDAQEVEDQVKLAVRNRLSELLEARESIRIQTEALVVARRRVDSTSLFLEAGRAEIRDVLEAQEDLLSAVNALTAARVDYRLSELGLQRDTGLLEVSDAGLWKEFEAAAGGP